MTPQADETSPKEMARQTDETVQERARETDEVAKERARRTDETIKEMVRQTDELADDQLPFGRAAPVILLLSAVGWGIIVLVVYLAIYLLM